MPRVSRLLIASVLGFALALILPVYPLHTEMRSFMTDGSGDSISYHWSFHTLFGLLGELQYQSSRAEPLLLAIVLFAAVAVALTAAASALLKRIFAVE